jgi:hypothetical protein
MSTAPAVPRPRVVGRRAEGPGGHAARGSAPSARGRDAGPPTALPRHEAERLRSVTAHRRAEVAEREQCGRGPVLRPMVAPDDLAQ